VLANLYSMCVAVTVRFSRPRVAMHSAPTCCPAAWCVQREAAESARVVLAGAEKPRLRGDSVPQASCSGESRTVPTTRLGKTFLTIKPLETRSANGTLAMSGKKVRRLARFAGCEKTGAKRQRWLLLGDVSMPNIRRTK